MKMKRAFSFEKDFVVRGWIDDEDIEGGDPPNKADYWLMKVWWQRIVDMDFAHLEEIVNQYSKEGAKVEPSKQDSFDNVMLTYLRKKLERTQHDIL
jgi:hypothetical protein